MNIDEKNIARAITIIRVSLYMLPVLVIGYVAYRNIAPLGTTTISQRVTHQRGAMSALRPAPRIADPECNLRTKECYQRMVGDSAYFDLRIPRHFDHVTASMTYRNSAQPIIEMGVRQAGTTTPFAMSTVQMSILDGLAADTWHLVERDGAISFWQRIEAEKQFSSRKDFEENYTRKHGEVLTHDYHFSGKMNRGIADTYTARSPKNYAVPLRGRHKLLVYVGEGEKLSFAFTFVGLDRVRGGDTVTLALKQDGKTVHEVAMTTEKEPPNWLAGEIRELTLEKDGLQSGVYELEVQTTDEVMITRWVTPQHMHLFVDRLFLAGHEEYRREVPRIDTKPITVYLGGGSISASAKSSGAEQEIVIDDEAQEVFYQQVTTFYAGSGSKIVSPKNNVLFEQRGLYAFDRDVLSDYVELHYTGEVIGLTSTVDDVNYIIARYTSPEVVDAAKGIIRASATFDTTHLFNPKDRRLEFIIKAPGIAPGTEIQLFDFTFDFKGKSLTSWFGNRLQRLR
jgi:hypothetical protein